MKIVHDKYKKEKKSDPALLEYLDNFQEAIKHNKELEACKGKLTQVCFYLLILRINVAVVK